MDAPATIFSPYEALSILNSTLPYANDSSVGLIVLGFEAKWATLAFFATCPYLLNKLKFVCLCYTSSTGDGKIFYTPNTFVMVVDDISGYFFSMNRFVQSFFYWLATPIFGEITDPSMFIPMLLAAGTLAYFFVPAEEQRDWTIAIATAVEEFGIGKCYAAAVLFPIAIAWALGNFWWLPPMVAVL